MKWTSFTVFAIAFLFMYAICYEFCGTDLGLARDGCYCTIREYKIEIVAKAFIPAAWVEAKVTRAPVWLGASNSYPFPLYDVKP